MIMLTPSSAMEAMRAGERSSSVSICVPFSYLGYISVEWKVSTPVPVLWRRETTAAIVEDADESRSSAKAAREVIRASIVN